MNDQKRILKNLFLKEKGIPPQHFNSTKKNFLLVSASSYSSMMQNMGLQTIYYILTKQKKGGIERSFTSFCRRDNKKTGIYSLESQIDVKNFDVIGFSISNPIQLRDFFEWMKLAGIPIKKSERSNKHPLIIAGGQGLSNPEPYTPFIDLFFMGDSQKSITEFWNLFIRVGDRDKLLKKIRSIKGIYYPTGLWRHVESVVEKKIVTNISSRFYNNCAALIIDKGCRFGCDFCQYYYNTGMNYRPYGLGRLLKGIDYLSSQGVSKVDIYSASSGNHHYIKEILDHMEKKSITAGLLDTRLEQMNDYLIKKFARRGGSFPLNLDSSSDRLRKIIKRSNMTNEQFIKLIKKAKQKYHITNFSAYVVINYPGETQRDLNELINFAKEALKEKIYLNLVIFPLFPSPNTPLQYAQMELPNKTRTKLLKLARKIGPQYKGDLEAKRNSLITGPHEIIYTSENFSIKTINFMDQLIEGITLRGDRKSGEIIYDLWENGYFSGKINYDLAKRYLDKKYPTWKNYFNQLDPKDNLPWAMIASRDITNYCKKRFYKINQP